VVRRAEIPQSGKWLAWPFHHTLSDARLADPGLSGDQDDLSVACLGLSPAAQEQLDLLVAAD